MYSGCSTEILHNVTYMLTNKHHLQYLVGIPKTKIKIKLFQINLFK